MKITYFIKENRYISLKKFICVWKNSGLNKIKNYFKWKTSFLETKAILNSFLILFFSEKDSLLKKLFFIISFFFLKVIFITIDKYKTVFTILSNY